METILGTMFDSHMSYHLWATREMIKSVQSLTPEAMQKPLGTSFGSLQGTLHHMFAADRIWVSRLGEEPNLTMGSVQVPERLEALATEWVTMLEKVTTRIGAFDSEEFVELREFVNSQGKRFVMPVWQILLHMVNHGTGHRGQVTSMVRQLGFTPAGTDLVQFYRAYSPNPENMRTAQDGRYAK